MVKLADEVRVVRAGQDTDAAPLDWGFSVDEVAELRKAAAVS